ncbi:hypothetical protein M5D96_007556 [Drosophila gunungcola]|uniref:BPTI/Kunitz inhibitor domain-containing protein n=1 Tax=Drosophila gunungcola TaxID=103775 RepID=A0A9P9YNF0_9MUSC|nr:hypothetical protein M5D96_007556 [Drosophila gunungcola]
MVHLISCFILLLILGFTIAFSYESYKQQKAICHLPVNYGKCGKGVFAWYYDPLKKSCIRFVYALCGGNRNRFFTKAECEELCLKDW